MSDPSPTRGTLAESPTERGERDEGEDGGFARGSLVGRYIVLEKVGAGGMGVVYAAFDPDLDRRIALKFLQPKRLRNPDALTRMVREAQALARLTHPNVVAVHDVGEARGGVFLAMEFVRGLTLSRWRVKHRPDWREVLEVMRAVGRGLAAAHDKGLVHRDIKPDNVMIDDDGRVRVMDFGLARPAASSAGGVADRPSDGEGEDDRSWSPALGGPLTNDGAIIGTVGYMAPEQYGGAAIDAAADQFSYCVTLWEALYGKRPFIAPTFEAMSIAVTSQNIVPPPRPNDVPAWLHRVVMRGLAVDPAARWPSMRALLEALSADPRPRRIRWLVATSVVGVGVATVAGVRWQAQRREAACVEAGAAIEEHWSPEVAAGVRAGIIASGVADPEAAFGRVTPWLDRYAETWRQAAGEVCVAATIEARFDAQLHVHAQDCLAERAAELDELVRLLLSPSADAVREAVTSASSLTPVAPCRDREQLMWSPVIGDERRADATAVRQLLARASIARGLGDPAASLSLGETALIEAKALGFDPLIARAHIEVGAACVARGEGERAQTELRTAYRLAAASGADDVAADAARRLVYVTGYQLENHDASELWYDVAEAILDRLHVVPQDARRAALKTERAAVRAISGRLRDARADFEEALDTYVAVFGQEHPEVVKTLSALSATEHQLDDHAAAERSASRALALLSRIWGDDHPERAMVLGGYSAVLEALGRHDESVAGGRTALSILERSFGADHPAVAGALNNLAMTLGAGDEAIALLRRALVIIEKTRGPNHREVAYCRNNLGHMSYLRGEFADAIREHTLAAEILEASPKGDALALAHTLHNLGVALEADDQGVAAERAFERALPVAQTAFGAEHPFVAMVRGDIGRARVRRGDDAGGIAMLEEAIAARTSEPTSTVDDARDQMYLARARWRLGGDAAAARSRIEASLGVFEARGHARFAELARTWLAALGGSR